MDGYGRGCAILLRTHHAIADGTALVQALLTLADRPADNTRHAGKRLLVGPSGPWVPCPRPRPATSHRPRPALLGRCATHLIVGRALTGHSAFV